MTPSPEQFELHKTITADLTRLQQNLAKDPSASRDDNVEDLLKQIPLFEQRERPNGTVKYSGFQGELRRSIDELAGATKDTEKDGQSEKVSRRAKELYECLLEN
jgi:hypothetical protein